MSSCHLGYVLCVSVLLTAGCGVASGGDACAGGEGRYEAGRTTADGLFHDGVRRTFRVRVPAGLEPGSAAPLVIMLHGGGGSGRYFETNSSRMNEVADREGFVVVYPDATGVLATTWNAGACCGAAARDGVDDVGFLEALLDHLESELCIDPRRIYVAGHSNGGMLAYRVGCELAGRVAAIASVAASEMTLRCEPRAPVAVLHVHGSDDANVPWEGGRGCGLSGASFVGVEETLARWRERNGCGGEEELWLEEGDGICVSARGCAEGGATTLCTIEGGGHEWPGGVALPRGFKCEEDGALSTSFSASEVIWRFFRERARPAR